jgi:N-acyl-D-amino-acid deacylase
VSILIRGAKLYDGSGSEPYLADVSISDGVIKDIGAELPEAGAEIVDAKGLSLSPGFIDAHGHSDISLLAAPEALGKISQGVTTEICGNCGLSAFPCNDEVKAHFKELYRQYDVEFNWSDFNGYAAELERRAPAINLVSLCGHNTLRACVCGYKDVPCGETQLHAMRRLLSTSLADGAAGLSTGLLYVPGKFSTKEELSSLASLLGRKPHTTHLRSEGARLLEALEEAVDISRTAACRLHVSHFKTSGRDNWHKLDKAIDLLQGSGLEITADRYPYIHSKTSLSIALPQPFSEMDDVSLRELLRRDGASLHSLEEGLLASSRDWTTVILASTGAGLAKGFCGQDISSIASALSCSPAQLVARLMLEDAPGTEAAFGGMSEDNLERLLSLPWLCCGSDESARPRDFSIGRSHPRGFGSFPRFINMLASKSGMAEALRRVTSLPASIFGLKGRGLVAKGFHADLVLFDERKLKDAATFIEPHALASGIEAVFVSGQLSYTPSGLSTGRSGRLLHI